MRTGLPFRGFSGSLTSDSRYAKYRDWLHSPPDFAAISLNGLDQQSVPPTAIAMQASVICDISRDAQEVNASPDMRFYLDDQNPSNAVIKISPHVNHPLIFSPVPCRSFIAT
jgi:hypothetical protein